MEVSVVEGVDGDRLTTPAIHLYCDAEQSSFEEVAGTCPNKDDREMRSLTIRSFLIGLVFVIGMSSFHMWIFVTPIYSEIAPVLMILLGHLFGKTLSLIPWMKFGGGPWTIKEHTIVLIMSNIAYSFYTVYGFQALSFVSWHERLPSFRFVFMFFLVVGMQFLGFGLAGELSVLISDHLGSHCADS